MSGHPHLLLCVLDDADECTCARYSEDAPSPSDEVTFEGLMYVLSRAEEAGLVTMTCGTHDVLPMTDEMEQAIDDGRICTFLDLPVTDEMSEQWESGYDPCLPVIGFTVETLKEHYE